MTEKTKLKEPFSRALSAEEFHGMSESDALRPQFSQRLAAVEGNLWVRRWLAGTAVIPGVPNGSWFMTEDLPPKVYVEDPFDVRLFRKRWEKFFTHDPRADDHNELVLARRFFSASVPVEQPESRRATRRAFEKVATARPARAYGESVMADPEKLRRLYRMWKGRALAC